MNPKTKTIIALGLHLCPYAAQACDIPPMVPSFPYNADDPRPDDPPQPWDVSRATVTAVTTTTPGPSAIYSHLIAPETTAVEAAWAFDAVGYCELCLQLCPNCVCGS